MAKKQVLEEAQQLIEAFDNYTILKKLLDKATNDGDVDAARIYTERLTDATITLEKLNKANEDLEIVIKNAKGEYEEGARYAAEDKKIKDLKKEERKARQQYLDRQKTFWGRIQNAALDKSSNGEGGILGGGGMFSKIAGGAALVTEGFSKFYDAYASWQIAAMKKGLNTFQANADIMMNQMDTTAKIQQRHTQTFGKTLSGALQSTFASITQGVQEGAMQASNASIDLAVSTFSNSLDDEIDLLKQAQYTTLRTAQMEQENLKLTNEQIMTVANGAASIMGVAFGPAWGAVASGLSSIAGTYFKMQEAKKDTEIEILKKEQEFTEKSKELYNNALKEIMSQVAEHIRAVNSMTSDNEKVVSRTDRSARTVGIEMGFNSRQMDRYEESFFNMAKNLTFTDSRGKTHYLDKNDEDMQKMQSAYIEASGRNIQMDLADYVKTSLLGHLTGDDTLAAALLGDMDIFNKNIEDSTDLINDMFTAANKAGVSNRKFAKELQQNLKLAQKYNFQGGVAGLMKMSIWAQKTRISMQSVDRVIESLQEGGLEGAIEKSAQLQVLGGNFAMYSNPLQMLADSFMDPEAMGKRMQKMVSGMGRFNSATGEVDFNASDQMFLRRYAQIAGVDYTEMMNAARQDIKNKQIDKSLHTQYTDEQKALLYTKAQYDQKTGEWQIKYTNREGKPQVKGINDLNASDFEAIMPIEERIEDKVSDIYDLLYEQGGVTKWSQATLADATRGDTMKNMRERIDENISNISRNLETLKSEVETANKFITEQNKYQHDLMVALSGVIEQEYKIIEGQNKNALQQIGQDASDFSIGLQNLTDKVNLVAAEIDFNKLSEAEKADENNEVVKKYKKAQQKFGESEDKFKRLRGIPVGGMEELKIQGAAEKWANDSGIYDKRGIIKQYDAVVAKHGELTKETAKYFDDVLTKDIGESEILNSLKNAEVIEHNDSATGLSEEEIKAVKNFIESARKYVVDQQPTNEKRTPNGYNWFDAVQYPSIFDGVVSGDGTPMYMSAKTVTPINDGQVALTHSMDTGIFAKNGGPFDTLFNGVFKHIYAIYDMLQTSFVEPSFTNENKTIYARSIEKLSNTVENNRNTGPNKPIDVNINGSIELKTGNQSFDIIEILRTNPYFVKQITEMVAYQISSNLNGGKTEMFPSRFSGFA